MSAAQTKANTPEAPVTPRSPSIERKKDENTVDLLSFGSHSGDFGDTVEALDGEGYNVKGCSPTDIEEDDEGELYIDGEHASIYSGELFNFRPSTFFGGLEDEYEQLPEEDKEEFESLEEFEQEIWSRLYRLETEYGLESASENGTQNLDKEYGIGHLTGVEKKWILESKSLTKELYSSMGVNTAESYTLEQALRKLRNSEPVIAKPESNNQGEGVEKLTDEQEIQEYLEKQFEGDYSLADVEQKLEFEEYLDTPDEDTVEKRMYFVQGDVYVAVKEHPEIDEGWKPQNSHAGGGHVEKVSLESLSGPEKEIMEAGKALGGIHAIDYIDPADGEARIIEDNGSPGQSTGEAVGVNLAEKEAEFFQQKIEGKQPEVDLRLDDLTPPEQLLRN